MSKEYKKVCKCGVEFTATHPATKKCDACRGLNVESKELALGVEETPKENIAKQPEYKPFLEVQQLSSVDKSILDVYNKNPNYQFMWRMKAKMGSGVQGIWHTVDKRHPDFAGMTVEQDDTPNESYFSTGDLVLTCCRMETWLAAKKRQMNFTRERSEGFEKRHKIALDRISREGMKGLSNKTSEEMDNLISDYSKK